MNWLGYGPAALGAAETLTTQQLYQGIPEIQGDLRGRKKSAVASEAEVPLRYRWRPKRCCTDALSLEWTKE